MIAPGDTMLMTIYHRLQGQYGKGTEGHVILVYLISVVYKACRIPRYIIALHAFSQRLRSTFESYWLWCSLVTSAEICCFISLS